MLHQHEHDCSISPEWCGLSKTVFQEFKIVPRAGRETNYVPIEEFFLNLFCSSNCNISNFVVVVVVSKDYIIMLAFHLFVDLFVF